MARAGPGGFVRVRLCAQLNDLKVVSANQGVTNRRGSIYVTLDLADESAAGIVPPNSDDVSRWIANFLKEPHQADVLSKLARSQLPEHHAFVIVPGFTSAPWPVPYFMTQDRSLLPSEAPHLPPEITHVWIASTWRTTCGLRWSTEAGWEHFARNGIVA